MADEVELTDNEIDELVAAVSEEVGLTSNEDDLDIDLDEAVDVKVPLKTASAEHSFADEVADKTRVFNASNVYCQDASSDKLNPESREQQDHKVTVGVPEEASYINHKTSLSRTCTDNLAADLTPQVARNIPGKALAVGSITPDLAVVNEKSEDSVSDPQNVTKVQSESAGSLGLAASAAAVADSYEAGIKSMSSQQSAKSDGKSSSSAEGWGWKSLGSWSSSVMSTATSFTSHVGESFYHMLETVESSLVEPEDGSVRKTVDDHHVLDSSSQRAENSTQSKYVSGEDRSNGQKHIPHERSRSSANNELLDEGSKVDATAAGTKPKSRADHRDIGWLPGWDLSSLTQLTGAVTSTGKKVVSTGLGVIGDIGKKTYNILMEDDEDSNTARKTNVKKNLSRKMFNLPVVYQDDAGIAHLEALEELSRWSSETLNKQLGSLKGRSSDAVHQDLALINDSFHLEDIGDVMDASDNEHDFAALVVDLVSQLGLQLSVTKLIETQANTRKWLVEQSLKVPESQQLKPQEAYEEAVRSFADLTTASAALYHKVAQLLLIENSGNPLLSYKFRALSLVSLTKVLCFEIYIQSSQFCHLLRSDSKQSSVIKSLVDGINLEAAESAKCLQDACCHLLPVMQLAVMKMHPVFTDHGGIAHLEGLQVLSNMSQHNVCEALSQFERESRRSVEAQLANIEASFDLGYLQSDDEAEQDNDAFNGRVLQLVQQLMTDVEAAQKLVAVQQRIQKYLKDFKQDESLGYAKILTNDVHQAAVQSLSDWTGASIELYYSIAQSMLLDLPRDVSLYAPKAATLASLTKLLCIEVGYISSQFTHCLSAAASLSDSVTPFVTNIYLEASSSSTYIQDGFKLLLPIIQLALLKAEPLHQHQQQQQQHDALSTASL